MMQHFIDQTYYAAIYLRLSKEDGDFSQGEKKESNSIANQRKLIEDYLKRHPEIIRVQEFCDDGFTGANFDRPDFQKMIEQVKKKKINCIIVKDLSCFGRDYLEVGDYLEHIFPFLGVRMISINDHYDSQNNLGNTAGMDVAFKKQIYDFYNKGSSQKTFTFHRSAPLPISA